MLRPGVKVGDRYVVIEQIAAGGMGTLWRAHHVELDVDVALKAITASDVSPDAIKRFKREAQAVARLRSPNIVQVLDYGVHEDQPYLAMELLHGQDLAARISRDGKVPLEQTVRIIEAVARAVQVAHDAGIVHRDLKPANIFLEKVGDEEVVKILDFGVAKDLRANVDIAATTAPQLVGSPAYMSPEQVWGEKVDTRTDVWAMGVVTFEMLTGCCPFVDETLAKVFDRIIRAPMPRACDLDPTLPQAVDAFFEKALARAPAERIASARDLAKALAGTLQEPESDSLRTSRKIALLPPPESRGTPFESTSQRTLPHLTPVEARVEAPRGSSPLRPLFLGIIVASALAAGALVLLRETSGNAPRVERVTPTSASRPSPSADAAPVASSPLVAAMQPSSSAAPAVTPRAPHASRTTAGPAPRGPVPSASGTPGRAAPSTSNDSTFGIPVPR